MLVQKHWQGCLFTCDTACSLVFASRTLDAKGQSEAEGAGVEVGVLSSVQCTS